MPIVWSHIGPALLASFLASLVECVEALTVVLAVGAIRGWRDAISGSIVAILVLLGLVAVLGSALTRIPLRDVQLWVGALLLLFGMRWLRKAILRAAGALALHDEAAVYSRQTQTLAGAEAHRRGWDKLAFATAFKITMLEGIEVVFIVIAIGAGRRGLLVPASIGAVAALVVVATLGLLVHRPLARIPENTLKFVVGALLCAFGVFWVGEGMGDALPGGDWAVPVLIAVWLAVALLCTHLVRIRIPDQREVA
ncbi:MAG: TMEM165/GDT1 family protein [Xanthomonadaceae bacterium]|nr:TMEM165/GDT1 family protein [Xanthomonadaceae bacterium]